MIGIMPDDKWSTLGAADHDTSCQDVLTCWNEQRQHVQACPDHQREKLDFSSLLTYCT